MKKINHLFVGLLAATSVFGMASCTKKVSDEDAVAQAKQELIFDDSLKSGVCKSFSVYNELEGVSITYTPAAESDTVYYAGDRLSFNETNTMCVINAEGLEDSVTTYFTAHFTKNAVSDEKVVWLIIKPCGESITVAEIAQYADAGTTSIKHKIDTCTTWGVSGIVAANSTKGPVIYDGTGYIYCYTACSYEVGTAVYCDGDLSFYSSANIFEFANCVYSQLYEDLGFTLPEFNPKSYNNENRIATWTAGGMAVYTGSMVKMTGTVTISGNYVNFNIDGVTAYMGSINTLSGTDVDNLITEVANTETKVEIQGYSIYYSGNKYLNLIVTSATKVA